MADADGAIRRHAIEFRVVLGALGAVQLLNGIWATLAPSSFYEQFPFGRGWVEALPAYNEHLMRDVGGLFLATGLVLVVAAVALERRLVLTAIWSYLLFSIPHAIYHYLNLEPYSTGDAVANAIALAATVLLPIWLLVRIRTGAPAAGADRARAAAPGSDGTARIAGVPESTRSPIARMVYRESRRRFGTVTDPLRLYAHHPRVLVGYAAIETATERSHLVDERLKLLAELRAGMIPGCEWCCDFGSMLARGQGITEDDLRALPTYASSDRFTELEKLVLDYATAISRSPVEVTDELFARLREHFDEPQLVELTNVIALENYRARFNYAFGLGSQGFSEGSYCVRPEAAGAAATA